MNAPHRPSRHLSLLRLLGLLAIPALFAAPALAKSPPMPGGELQIISTDGSDAGICPLKHTAVESDIAGFIARTTVKQVFHNPSEVKIEAVYVFPLPDNAAVDAMTMLVGDRRIIGQIKERDEARQIYEQAKAAGHVASLLDQERPNIFTQSVANIEPGVQVEIEITYVETLKYEDGVFEWGFPMVVGPRYIPGGGSAPEPMKTGAATPQVPDAHKITPPIVPEGQRAGHDISLTVHIDGGMEMRDVESVLHDVNIASESDTSAVVTLARHDAIPNKDFILRYKLGGDNIGDAFLAHHDERGDFFTLILQPPQRVQPEKLVPRELIFVLDTSGSMHGFPIEKAKETMAKLIDTMQPVDTFNLITFAGSTRILWNEPRPNTPQDVAEAQKFLTAHRGSGGTEMMKAINAALVQTRKSEYEGLSIDELLNLPADGRSVSLNLGKPSVTTGGIEMVVPNLLIRENDKNVTMDLGEWRRQWEIQFKRHAGAHPILDGVWSTEHGRRVLVLSGVRTTVIGGHAIRPLRVVCFMTDGYVGNDFAIIDAVKKNAGTTRVFSFGVGNSVNRFLLDGMAHAGRGEVEYVSLRGKADESVTRFHERVLAPVLTDIRVDWGSLPVADVFPKQIPDLFSAKPIMIHGRLTGPPAGTITLYGQTGAGAYVDEIRVSLPGDPPDHDALASLWARANVADLMNQDLNAMQSGNFPAELKQQIVDLGLEFNLMTQFTSFVAVEEMTVTAGGEPVKVNVPVEMPEGVSYEGIFGGTATRAPAMARRGVALGGRMAPASVGAAAHGGRGRLASPPPKPMPASKATVEQLRSLGYLADTDEAREEAQDIRDAMKRQPELKLAEPLRDLAKKVESDGEDGTLTVGKIKVIDYRVDVIVILDNVSDKTRKLLEDLGFKITGESKTVSNLLVGSIDVRKLNKLTELEEVRSVRPVQ